MPAALGSKAGISNFYLRSIAMQMIMKFIQEEDGVTAIEYALIAALIAAVIVISVTALGVKVDTIFKNITTAI
jgi:pilus assembly protein Flp/PilA